MFLIEKPLSDRRRIVNHHVIPLYLHMMALSSGCAGHQYMLSLP